MHCQCSRCSKALKRVPALGQYTANHEMCEIKADIDSRSARGRSMRLEWFAKNDPTMYADLEAVWPDIGRPPLQPRIIVAKHVPAPIHECLHSPTNATTGTHPFTSKCVQEQLGLNCLTCKRPQVICQGSQVDWSDIKAKRAKLAKEAKEANEASEAAEANEEDKEAKEANEAAEAAEAAENAKKGICQTKISEYFGRG